MTTAYLTKTTNYDRFTVNPNDHTFSVKVTQRQKKIVKTEVCNHWLSLDTETAWNHDEENPLAWIYQWCFKFAEQIVIGRRPSEFVKCLVAIRDALDIKSSRKMLVFVHNLSFDISYLWQFLRDEFGKEKILAVKPHKYITFETGGFIFRCTYKLSNKSLSTWANDLDTDHKKIAEEKAYYDEIHYQDEDLPPEKWEYQIGDVLTLDDCVKKQMESYGDTVLTMPLTSTGYVRRDARRHFKEDRRNRKRFLLTRLNAETYAACREEFAGGLTHGNRFYAGVTVKPDREKGEFIRHRDFRSHYPSQQRTRYFPVGKFVKYGSHLTIDQIKPKMKDFCILMKVVFENVDLKPWQVLPVISATKAYKGRYGKLDIVEDNGRALSINGVFALYLTELDLHWIVKQYKIEHYDIEECWIAEKGPLPEYMKKTVDEYFYGKTRWKKELAAEKAKGEAADRERIIWLSLELMKSKNGLNGIYGMSATDIVRISYEIDEKGEWKQETPTVEDALVKFYASENSFNRYQFGIYTTSWARFELLEYAELIMKTGGKVLYVDTDSIFYLSNEAVENAIEAENERRKQRAIERGAYIEYDGQMVTYDAFDDEGEDITAFRFLHAKCYAYECNGKLHCTIAGVTEWEDSTHKFNRVDELGSIEELTKGKVFTRCGGTSAIYTNTARCETMINGHKIEMGNACIIRPTTKTLKSELDTYDEIIEWEVE